jgi:hypothetical protein
MVEFANINATHGRTERRRWGRFRSAPGLGAASVAADLTPTLSPADADGGALNTSQGSRWVARDLCGREWSREDGSRDDVSWRYSE